MKKIIKQSEESRAIIPYFLFFLLGASVCIILSVLVIYLTKDPFLQNNKILLSIISWIFCNVLYCISFHVLRKGNTATLRSLIVFYLLLLFVLLFIYFGQSTGFFLLLKDSERLQDFLQKAGWWMPICYIILQYLQVTILPIPSIVSTLVGVRIFGALKATIFSFIGIFLGSITAFFLGRKLGKRAVSWIIGNESLQKWQQKLKGKDKFFLTMMFLLPLFPDDMLCFVAGLSSISTKFFIAMTGITRLIAIITSCCSFQFIPFDTWWGVLIWLLIFIVLSIICVIIYKNGGKINKKIKNLFSKQKN